MLLAPSASPFEICGYLLRCCEKINPQRIISDMDVGGSRQERVRSANSSLSSCTGMYNCLTVYFKRLTEGLFSERTGMSVVPHRSDVFAQQKLASRSVHGCTLLDRLFQKVYGKCVFKSGGGVCIYFVLHKINTRRFRSGMDAAGSTQKRVCLQTRSPK